MDGFRGLKKANIEALMVVAGHNVKRLVGWRRGRGPRSVAQAAAPCASPNHHRCALGVASEGVMVAYRDA
jgi:hypothetical protein